MQVLDMRKTPIHSAVIAMLWVPVSYAADFNEQGYALPEFVAPVVDRPDLIFELGFGVGAAPAYQGSNDLGMTFSPIIRLERLNIPGVIDIGGSKSSGGFKFAPSFDVQAARKAEDYPELTGLNDIDMTFELGGKVGYEFVFNETLSAEVYGKLRYAFGGAEGLVGDVGLDVTSRLTPQLEIVGGISANLASEEYMGTYFDVTDAEAVASNGNYQAYTAEGGVQSVGAKVTAKYEFIPDTFFNASLEYRRLVGSAADSPIVADGGENQFLFGVGLSRRFSIDY